VSEGWLTAAKLLAVVALVLANGFFVASEFALVAIRRSRVDELVARGVMGARAVQRATRNLDHFIAATQLGITLASLALGWLGEPTLGHLLHEWLGHAPAAGTLSVAIAFAIITSLHIVVGELAPKSIALQYPEKTSLAIAQPLGLFDFIFRPFIVALNSIGRFTIRLLGLRAPAGHELVHSAAELRMLVEASGRAGVLEESEREIINRAFDFADFHARELMVPRVEVAAVPAAMTGPELLSAVVTAGFSRYPVYDGSLDQVLGIVHIKDAIAALEGAGSPEAFAAIRARDLVRSALVVPETLPVDDLLAQLRGTNARMAIVIDEFGGMAGIVTMENLLERLVGSLRDEFERATPADFIQHPDGSVSISGLTLIEDANDLLGLEIEDPEDDTIGGYVFSRIGHLPEVGDTVEVDGHQLRVESMDDRRVDRVLVMAVPRDDEHRPPKDA
jgi:CBS domain containing-hemolysin-like protein